LNQHIQSTASHNLPIDVRVNVRAESLTLSRRGAIFGEIFITLNAHNFPDGRWNDFIVVVLGWWCEQCANLLRGRLQAELWFMDGPFFVQLQRTEDEVWAIRFLRHRAVASPGMVETEPVSGLADPVAISSQTFVGSVVRASEVILNECARRGWTRPEIDDLKREWSNLRLLV
jgi:hypothetical protein